MPNRNRDLQRVDRVVAGLRVAVPTCAALITAGVVVWLTVGDPALFFSSLGASIGAVGIPLALRRQRRKGRVTTTAAGADASDGK